MSAAYGTSTVKPKRTRATRLEMVVMNHRLWNIVESDAIASALTPTILPSGVPIYTCRGQASKTFIQAAARDSAALGKPIHILYAGDWDPTGLAIDRSLEERYQRYADDGAHISIDRVAVHPMQIVNYGLTGGPAKSGDPNYKRFVRACDEAGLPVAAIEAEELPPSVLRQCMADAIKFAIDETAWNAVIAYEEAEKAQLEALSDHLRATPWPSPNVGHAPTEDDQ